MQVRPQGRQSARREVDRGQAGGQRPAWTHCSHQGAGQSAQLGAKARVLAPFPSRASTPTPGGWVLEPRATSSTNPLPQAGPTLLPAKTARMRQARGCPVTPGSTLNQHRRGTGPRRRGTGARHPTLALWPDPGCSSELCTQPSLCQRSRTRAETRLQGERAGQQLGSHRGEAAAGCRQICGGRPGEILSLKYRVCCRSRQEPR